MSRIVVVGSLNLDLVATADRLPRPGETVAGTGYAEHPGGKGLNQAVAAARAGGPAGPSVSMIGALGDDAAAELLRSVADEAGVDTSPVVTIGDTPSGRAVITVDAAAENSIVVVPGANGRLRPAHVRPEVVVGAAVVMAQLETPIPTVVAAMRAGRAAGATTVLDPAPVGPLPDELLAGVDLIVPNEHELDALGGMERLAALGVAAVVVTLGAEGAELRRADGSVTRFPGVRVDPVDTTGSGDAFRGALASRLAAGDDLAAAIPVANAAGAAAATVAGAVPSLPSADRIRALLR